MKKLIGFVAGLLLIVGCSSDRNQGSTDNNSASNTGLSGGVTGAPSGNSSGNVDATSPSGTTTTGTTQK